MYIPEPFIEKDQEIVIDFIRSNSFCSLTGLVGERLHSVHLPVIAKSGEDGLKLQGHLSKHNPFSRCLTDRELLLQFLGPHSYIPPNWYAHDKHYPTWIYVAVHLYGHARILDSDELDIHLEQLIQEQEHGVGSNPPWSLSKMPNALSQHLKKMVVGFEISATQMQASFKLNQHKQKEDVDAMVRQLKQQGAEGKRLADLVLASLQRTDNLSIINYISKYKVQEQ